jgi:hypothetical protein
VLVDFRREVEIRISSSIDGRTDEEWGKWVGCWVVVALMGVR